MASEVRVPELHPGEGSAETVVTDQDVVETNGSVHSFDGGISGSASDAGDVTSSADELAGPDRDKSPSSVSRRWPWSRFRRKRKDRDVRKNGDSKSVSSPAGASPPVERKSKLSALGKIFRPWKWKRKKKSERFEKTAVEIERKISMRTSREELIRKGVIREPDGSPIQSPGLETVPEKEEEKVKQVTDVPGADNVEQVSPGLVAGPGSQPQVTSETLVRSAAATTVSPCSTITVTTTAEMVLPLTASTALSSTSALDCPVVVSTKCPSPVLQRPPYEALQHPPPPKYTEALAQVAPEMLLGARLPTVTFQPVGEGGFKRVNIAAPQEDHSDSEGTHDDDGDDDVSQSSDSAINPDMIPPHSPYQAVLASEPDLTKQPHKSALKKVHIPGAASAGSSWTTRPLDTSRASPVPPSPQLVRAEGQQSPRLGPAIGDARPIPRPRVTIQAVGDDGDKENTPSVQFADPPPYNSLLATDSDDSEDEEIKYRDDFDPNSLAAKVARNDSLARFLESRPTKNDLVAKNIIPSQTETEKKVLREAIGSQLTRRLSLRPTQEELENRNILHDKSDKEAMDEKERKKRYLIRKLSFRPSIEELRERKIIDFNDYVEVTDAQEYDRRADKPWTRLTPRDKAAIRKELNEFKSKEMGVHEDSRHFTRFHKP